MNGSIAMNRRLALLLPLLALAACQKSTDAPAAPAPPSAVATAAHALENTAKAVAAASDEQRVHDYVPTIEKARAYGEGMRALRAAEKEDPSLRKGDIWAASNKDDGHSLAQAIDKVGRFPQFDRFFGSRGLSKEDVVLLPTSLLGACAIAVTPQITQLPETVSPGQVAFCKENRAALDKAGVFDIDDNP